MSFDPDNLSEKDKKIIRAGILQGIADVEVGHVQELNEDLIIELKSKIIIRLANRKSIYN